LCQWLSDFRSAAGFVDVFALAREMLCAPAMKRQRAFLHLFAELVAASVVAGCGGSVEQPLADKSGEKSDSEVDTARGDTAFATDSSVEDVFSDDTAIELDTGTDSGADTYDACSMPCSCYKPPPPVTAYKPYTCMTFDESGNCTDSLNCYALCGPNPMGFGPMYATCRYLRSDAGEEQLECVWPTPPCGRRTEGQDELPCAPTTAADWLATAAFLEAGSVDAFLRLSAELAQHGAPMDLVRATRRAAADEVRHARDVSRLARRYGVEPKSPARVRNRRRSLARIARENAVEGCIRETYGALVATYQAKHAEDPAVREAFVKIAAEETAHAALSWDIAEWAESKLSPRQRARLARARREEIAKVARELAHDPAPELVQALGLPRAPEAQSLFAAMIASLT
jgi:hypothetical protein